MQKITPFLWFDGQAEQAAELYTRAFARASIEDVTRYGDGMPMPAGTVLTVAFRLAGQAFVALNGGPQYRFTPAASFWVNCQSMAELQQLWAALLASGGDVLMPLQAYPFSPQFGWLHDRFGLTWQLHLSGEPQSILPALLFVGDQYGKAQQAMQQYTAIFPDSGIELADTYGPGEGERPGVLRQGRFRLAGQLFQANDSGIAHQFTFTPAVSFSIDCLDQAEVDYFWNALSAGGEEGDCGWLTDRYGVSWQVVPQALSRLMGGPDPVRASRVTQAMLQMKKLDVSALQQAYDQG